MLTDEERRRLCEGAKERMDANVKRWLADPDVRAALKRNAEAMNAELRRKAKRPGTEKET